METTVIRTGARVLARTVDGHLRAYTYMTFKQAAARAATIPGATVIRPNSSYLVKVPE